MKKISLLISIVFFIINYVSAQSIQNGNFENWQTVNYYDYPKDWYIVDNSNYTNIVVEKVNDAKQGNFSVKLNSVATPDDTLFGVTLYGTANKGVYKGNPYSQLGDYFHFWYKANIQPGDMGMMWLMLYKNGILLDSIVHPLFGNINSWTEVVFPVNTSQIQPDSMFLAFLSSVPKDFGGSPLDGSWLMVDNVYFTLGADTTPIPVPNYSFEDWATASSEEPLPWVSTNSKSNLLSSDTANVVKTLDAFSGNYAAKLSVVDIMGDTLNGKLTYTQPFTYQPETMSFYYKYLPVGVDTAQISVEFIKNNSNVGGALYQFVSPTYNYTQEVLNLFYNEIPDQIIIRIETGRNSGSTLTIDDIKFSCTKPKNFFGEFVSANSAQLNWSAGATESEWQIESGLHGFTHGTGTHISVNNQPAYLATGISDVNDYDFYIRAVCNVGDTSNWAGPFTVCKSANIPLSLDFESVLPGEIPECWHSIISGSATVKTNNIGNAHNGSRYLSMNINNDQTAIFTSPEIDDTLSGLYVSFYSEKASWSSHATIILGTMSNPSDPNTFVELSTFVLSNTYQNYTYYLNSYTGTDKYIAFKLATNDWGTEVYLDDILIDFAPSCIPPSSLAANNITINSALIKWHAGGNETLWNLIYGPEGFNPDSTGISLPGLTLTSYNLSSLSSGTSYDVYVQADCGSGDTSTWTKINFTTLCVAYNVPLIEDFESVDAYDIPNCWKSIHTSGSEVHVVSWGQSTSGNNSLKMYWQNNIGNTMFITPEMSNPLNQLFISFKAKTSNCTNQPLITVGTMSNPDDENSFTPITTFQTTSVFESYQYYFNDYVGSNAYIAIKLSSNQVSYTEVLIDDIYIDLLPSCIPPNTLTVQNMTINSAQVNWQPGNNETLWNLIYGTEGFNPNTEGTTVSGLTTTHYNFNNSLNTGTSYDVYIQANCSGNSLSSWIKKSFTTLCLPYAVPLNESFESAYIPFIPNCWQKITTDSAKVESVNWNQATSGVNSLRMQTHSPDVAFLITPEIVENIKALYITFNSKKQDLINQASIVLGTISDPTDKNTFDSIAQFNLSDSYQTFEYYFDSYTGTDHYIALKLTTGSNADVLIDDIFIDSIPSCFKPVNVHANNITATSVHFTWQPGNNDTLWNMICVKGGLDPFTHGVLKSGIDTSAYTINGLSQATSYDVILQSDCGGGDLSVWTAPVHFTTPCNIIDIPYTENFDNTNSWEIPVCWNKIIHHSDGMAFAGLSNAQSYSQSNDIYLWNAFIPDASAKLLMITPQVTGLHGNQVRFFAKSNVNNTPLNIGTMGNPNDTGTFTNIQTINLTTDYTEYIVQFINYSGNDKYIAFSHGLPGAGNNKAIYIDNFVYEIATTCFKPTSLNASNITNSSAALSWVENNSATSWNVEWGITGFSLGSGDTATASTNHQFTIHGLISNLKYDFYVQANCGGGDMSVWAGPYSFTTLCDTFHTPFSENFNAILQGEIPACWQRTVDNWKVDLTHQAGGSSPELIFDKDPHVIGHSAMISPLIDATTNNTLMVSFRHALTHHLGNPYSINVEITTDDVNWTNVWSLTPSASISSQKVIIDISSYAGQNIRVAWVYDGDSWDTDKWFIDNILIDEVPYCPTPTALNASNITTTSAVLGWVNDSTETRWQIEYGLAGFINGTGTYVTAVTNPFTLTGLQSVSTYDFYVRAICDTVAGDTSTWSVSHQFTTLCETLNVPYFQGFESIIPPAIPICHSIENAGSGNNWKTQNNPGYGFINNTLFYKASSNYAANAWFFTQGIQLIKDTTYRISFKYGNNSTSWTEKLKVAYGTSQTSPAMSNQLFEFQSINLGVPQNATMYFTPDSSGVYYFGFNAHSLANQNYLYVDDIAIDIAPSCHIPTNLNTDSITTNTAVITWDSIGGGSQFQIEWGEAPFTQGTGTVVLTTNNTYQLTGLNSSTEYEFFNRTICGVGDTSNWSGPSYFMTKCDLVSDFYENFDTLSNYALPLCWKKLTTTGSAYTYTANNFSAPNSLYLFSSSPADILVVTMQQVDNAGADTHRLRFRAKAQANAVLEVGYLTDPTDANTFVLLQSILFSDNQYHEYKIYPGTAPGASTTFAFRTNGTPPIAVSVDDVYWEAKPSCVEPVTQNVTNITLTTADLGWITIGTETKWQVEYGVVGFLQDTGADTIITTNPYSISGLQSGITYEFYVRAICDTITGDTSTWTGPYQFTTACDIYLAPFIETFESVAFPPVCWNLTTGSDIWKRSANAGGYGNSTASALADFFNISGNTSFDLITFEFNATALNNPQLKFDYAYATRQAKSDKLDIYSSTDGGNSYSLLLPMPGGVSGILNTAGNSTAAFVPTNTQWETKMLSLPAGTNKVKFTATSANGNNLYVDNVVVCNNYEYVENIDFCMGESYTWRGNTYSAAGTYYDSLQTYLGCDSVYILNVVVKPSYLFTLNKSICIGDVFNWRGNNYSSNSLYYDSLQTTLGCDSVYKLNLTVNPLPSVHIVGLDSFYCADNIPVALTGYPLGGSFSGLGVVGNTFDPHIAGVGIRDIIYIASDTNGCINSDTATVIVNPVYEFPISDSICSGDFFIWRGNYYYSAGNYYDSLHTASGCDSVYILHLIVHPVYMFAQTVFICNGEVFHWHGNDYTETESIYENGQSVFGCDSMNILHLIVSPAFEFEQTESICTGDVFNWQGNNYSTSGNYYDSLQTAIGCDSVYVLHLTVNPVYLFTQTETICSNDFLIWRGNIYTVAGSYYDSLQTSSGCDSVYVLHLIVDPESVGGTLATGTSHICVNTSTSSMTLSGQTGNIVRWEKRLNGGIWYNISCTSTTYSETLSTSGVWDYRVLVQSANCDAVYSSTITITVLPNASIASVTGTTPLCIGGTATFTANSVVLSGGTGTWSTSNSSVATVNASGLVTGASAGNCNIIYTITGGCGGTKTAQQAISINPVLPVSVSISASANPVCAGTSVTFTATPVNGGTTPVYVWKVNGNTTGTNNHIFTINTLANNDIITCIMTSSNTLCATGSPATSNSITIVVKPVFEFLQTEEICDGDILLWRGNNYSASGFYYDSLQTSFGCDSIFALHLIVNPVYESIYNGTICNGSFLTWRGNNYSTADTYYDSLQTSFGCDSIFVLNLSVSVVNVNVSQNGPVLTSNATGAAYQWVDCDNAYAIIPNETNSIFTATANGNYAVVVTQNSCKDTSACFNVTGVFTNTLNSKMNVNIYPNPNDGNFILVLDEDAYITVYNFIGEIVFKGFFVKGNHTVSFNHLSSGVYNINAAGDNILKNIRMIIQK